MSSVKCTIGKNGRKYYYLNGKRISQEKALTKKRGRCYKSASAKAKTKGRSRSKSRSKTKSRSRSSSKTRAGTTMVKGCFYLVVYNDDLEMFLPSVKIGCRSINMMDDDAIQKAYDRADVEKEDFEFLVRVPKNQDRLMEKLYYLTDDEDIKGLKKFKKDTYNKISFTLIDS
jgi:hypothetical protein